MGQFTLYDDPELDRKIQNDLDICVAELKHEFGDQIVCLQLVGGYGRGEGGVRVEDGIRYPKNNYDFLIVLKSHVFQRTKKIQRLKSLLNTKLLIKFEPSIRSVPEMAQVPFIMFYYDVFHMSKCVYGEDVKKFLPSKFAKQTNLPKSESLKILRNRLFLYALLGCKEKHLGYEITDEQRKIWFAKFVIGLGDSFAILLDKYKVSYQDKRDSFQDLDLSSFNIDVVEQSKFKLLHEKASNFRLYDNEFDIYPIMIQDLLKHYLEGLCGQRDLFSKKFVKAIHEYLAPTGKSCLKNVYLNIKEFKVVSALAPMDLLLPYILLFYIDQKKGIEFLPKFVRTHMGKLSFKQDFLLLYEKYLV